METCLICGEVQDHKQYGNYNICTTCADVMEDVMGEFFLRTICNCSKPQSHETYFNYLNSTSKYISDYKKITSRSKKYERHISEKASDAIEKVEVPSKQRYFERMQIVVKWLEDNPAFYHYYFKKYYVCPVCGASIFERYAKEEIGDWIVISCSGCGELIKKYFAPKTL